MIRFPLLLWLLALSVIAQPAIAQSVGAQPVRVTSGAHDGFSRLALQLPAPADWRLTRLADGYALQIAGQDRYDISRVFRLIGHERLAAIWVDPATGVLRLGLRCACHAMPFVYRADVLVIDLRDGPPPIDSVFEQTADGSRLPPLSAQAPVRPRARPQLRHSYDWRRIAGQESGVGSWEDRHAAGFGDRAASPLRAALRARMDRDPAAAGSAPLSMTQRPAVGKEPGQIRILPAAGQLAATEETLSAEGRDCPDQTRLDFSTWIGTGDVAAEFAPAFAGLSGEFDRPDPEAVARATYFLLALGFGAEARGLLDAFPTAAGDEPLWRSLGYILDEEEDPAPAFADLAACETPAALWALLTPSGPQTRAETAVEAALAGFSDLPPHLRQHLGPRLGRRLLALGLDDAAEAVRGILQRAPDGGDEVQAVAAELALARGDGATAEGLARALVDTPGPATPEALATLVEARAAQGVPVEEAVITTLEALLRERADDTTGARLARALVLARAARGEYEVAFAALHRSPATEALLWQMLAETGSDDVLIVQALSHGPGAASVPQARRIAERLIDLGLGHAAIPWLAADPDPDPLLQARAALLDQDGRAALRFLAGDISAAAEALRARALELLGAEADAAAVWSRIGDEQPRVRAEIRARNWADIARTGSRTWRDAAALASASPPGVQGSAAGADTGPAIPAQDKSRDPPSQPKTAGNPQDSAPKSRPQEGSQGGPLTRARALAASSAEAAAVIDALLVAVAQP